MARAVSIPFQPPAIPWLEPLPLAESIQLGEGLDPCQLSRGLHNLCSQPEVQAVVAFGSRARGEARPDSDLDLAVICKEGSLPVALKTSRSRHYRRLLGLLDHGVDLVVIGADDALRLAGSRWHVMGDAARDGLVLYVAR
ncbi:MAG: nucleotidyltransferase domain-containing protein [Cyanobacteriota bacterium]|jgi:predicted nucleotidyltransferase